MEFKMFISGLIPTRPYTYLTTATQTTILLALTVTRFGKIPPLRQKIKVFGNFLRVYKVLGKILSLLLHFLTNHLVNKFSLLQMTKY